MQHLQQFFRAGNSISEIDAYYDVKNSNSYEILSYSSANVQVQIFDASGTQMSSDTIPASVISTQLLGGPLQFVYGSSASPNLWATSSPDEFILKAPSGGGSAKFNIFDFDPSKDIIALSYLSFGNDQQITHDTHSSFGGALISSLDGTS